MNVIPRFYPEILVRLLGTNNNWVRWGIPNRNLGRASLWFSCYQSVEFVLISWWEKEAFSCFPWKSNICFVLVLLWTSVYVWKFLKLVSWCPLLLLQWGLGIGVKGSRPETNKQTKNRFWIAVDTEARNVYEKLKYVKYEGKSMSSEMEEVPKLVR